MKDYNLLINGTIKNKKTGFNLHHSIIKTKINISSLSYTLETDKKAYRIINKK